VTGHGRIRGGRPQALRIMDAMRQRSRDTIAVDDASLTLPRVIARPTLADLREALLWLVVIAGVLNFGATMFSQSSVSTQTVWAKGAKDVPAALLLALLAYEVVKRRSLANRRDLRRLTAAVAALAAYMALSALAIASPAAGDAVSAQYYLVYPLLAVGLAAVPLSAQQVDRFLRLFIALGVLESLLAIPDALAVFAHTYYSFYYHGTLFNRAVGTLGNPNNLGLFLGLCLIIAASNAARLPAAVRVASIALMVVGIMLTLSKTAPIALAVSLFFLTYGPPRRRAMLEVGAIAAALVVAYAAVVIRSGLTAPPVASAPVAAATAGSTGGRSSSQGASGGSQPASPATTAPVASAVGNRGQTGRAALDQWTSSPKAFLVGSGFATLADVGSGGKLDERVVDNMALGLALEGGVLGLALVGLVIIAALWPLIRAGARDPLVDIARAYSLFFLLYTPVAVNLRLFPVALFFWVILGLGLATVGRGSSAAPGAG